MSGSSVHASAVLVGQTAVLIRGPSGAGKSRLAFDLILAGRARQIPATLLIGDDRIDLSEQDGRLIASPVPALAGLLEIRGLGIRKCHYAEHGVVGLAVDLQASDGERLPAAGSLQVQIGGVTVPRLPVPADFAPLPMVLGALTTQPADCPQGLGNHMWSTLATL